MANVYQGHAMITVPKTFPIEHTIYNNTVVEPQPLVSMVPGSGSGGGTSGTGSYPIGMG